MVGCEDERDFWEEKVVKVGTQFCLSKLKKLCIGGEGAVISHLKLTRVYQEAVAKLDSIRHVCARLTLEVEGLTVWVLINSIFQWFDLRLVRRFGTPRIDWAIQ